MKELKKVLNTRIKKNLLPSIYFNKLNQLVMGRGFPWYYLNQTVSYPGVKQDDHFMFVHVLYNTTPKTPTSTFFKEFEPILYFLDYPIKELLRMKLNLYTNQNKKIKHVRHTDIYDYDKNRPREKVTLSLFNFVTCNGGTLINKKKYSSNANELVIFDNAHKHSGIVQTDTQVRVVLNIATI
jgi:hypothetical protein